MKAARWCVVIAIAWWTQTAPAQAKDGDWLDKLSGPGPFWAVGGTYRFVCLSRTSDQENFQMLGFAETDATQVSWQSPISKAGGVVPIGGIPPSLPVPTAQQNAPAYRQREADINCARDRRIRAYATTSFRFYQSVENPLFPSAANDSRYRVRMIEFGLGYAVRIHPALDVGIGTGLFRITGQVFEPLYRVSVIPLKVDFAPLAWKGDGGKSRFVTVGLALVTFFPGFEAADFCQPARDTARCAGLRSDFTSTAEPVWRVSVHFDPGALLR